MTTRARATVVALCLAGAAAASWARWLVIGGLSVGDVPWLWPRLIVAALGAVAGIVYWRALAEPRQRDGWSALLVGAVAIHLAAAMALPLTSNDLWSNLAYGRLVTLGHNPYLVGPAILPADDPFRQLVDPRWLELRLPYGPLVGWVCALAGWAGGVISALVAFKAVMLACVLGSIAIAWHMCRALAPGSDGRTRFLLFAWCPLFAWEISGQAHNDGLLILALVGFVWAVMRQRELIAAACLAAAVSAKFVAAPVAAFYLVYVARRSPLRAFALASSMMAACGLAILPWWHGPSTLAGAWLQVAPNGALTSRSFAEVLSSAGRAIGPLAQRVAYDVAWVAGLVVLAVTAIHGLLRVRTRDDVIHHSLLLLLVYDLFAAAWFQPWYANWILPFAFAHTDARWRNLAARYTALMIVSYATRVEGVNVAIDLYVGFQFIALVRQGLPANMPLPERSAVGS